MESSIRGSGYESLIVKLLTLRKSIHRRILPSFLVTSTTGDAQLLEEGSITSNSKSLRSSSFNAFSLASGSLLGPSLTFSGDFMFIECWHTSVVEKSLFDLENRSSNPSIRLTAILCSSWLMVPTSESSSDCRCSGSSTSSSKLASPSALSSIGSSRSSVTGNCAGRPTGSHVATLVPLLRVCGLVPKFTTRTGRHSWVGFTSARAIATFPSHKVAPFPSTNPCVKCMSPSTAPGSIISLSGGTTTVSAIFMR